MSLPQSAHNLSRLFQDEFQDWGTLAPDIYDRQPRLVVNQRMAAARLVSQTGTYFRYGIDIITGGFKGG